MDFLADFVHSFTFSVRNYSCFPIGITSSGISYGQEVDGELFGSTGKFHLPAFDRVSPYLSRDDQVEVDTLAEGEGVRWVVEIKWRNKQTRLKQTGLKEMQKLLQKAQVLEGQPWYISQAGFTNEAIDFAQDNQIFYSSRPQIEALSKAIKSY